MLLRLDRMDEDDQLANEAGRLVIRYLHSDIVDASCAYSVTLVTHPSTCAATNPTADARTAHPHARHIR